MFWEMAILCIKCKSLNINVLFIKLLYKINIAFAIVLIFFGEDFHSLFDCLTISYQWRRDRTNTTPANHPTWTTVETLILLVLLHCIFCNCWSCNTLLPWIFHIIATKGYSANCPQLPPALCFQKSTWAFF